MVNVNVRDYVSYEKTCDGTVYGEVMENVSGMVNEKEMAISFLMTLMICGLGIGENGVWRGNVFEKSLNSYEEKVS